jgi:hypothetical protein
VKPGLYHRAVWFTVLLWLIVVLAWAYLYGNSGLAAAKRAPQEDLNYAWSFWLIAFAIFRLPYLVLTLVVALVAEKRFLDS